MGAALPFLFFSFHYKASSWASNRTWMSSLSVTYSCCLCVDWRMQWGDVWLRRARRCLAACCIIVPELIFHHSWTELAIFAIEWRAEKQSNYKRFLSEHFYKALLLSSLLCFRFSLFLQSGHMRWLMVMIAVSDRSSSSCHEASALHRLLRIIINSNPQVHWCVQTLFDW